MGRNEYYMWISRISGLGHERIDQLLEYFGDPYNVFCASRIDLKSCGSLSDKVINEIYSSQDDNLVKEYIEELKTSDIQYISIADACYPELLKEIDHPPLGLYIKGDVRCLNNTNVSIIGSRRCSEYGLTVAEKLCRDLVCHDVTIVSGMARGIDSMAHRSAIDGGGKTIAVLGCGVDVCYPHENRALKENIIKNGCVISEYPPKTRPYPVYFPARNRIISGLSMVTVIVEAGKKSGTIITADQALAQGREVLAVPGNITSKLSEATNDLIKQGCVAITNYKDILEVLGLDPEDKGEERNLEKNMVALEPEEELVYDCIQCEPVTVDFIISKTKGQAQTVNSILTILELKGLVKKLPGQKYSRSL